jgi:hypothetical protein
MYATSGTSNCSGGEAIRRNALRNNRLSAVHALCTTSLYAYGDIRFADGKNGRHESVADGRPSVPRVVI